MSYFFAACNTLYSHPLYEAENFSVLLYTRNYDAMREYLLVVASCGQMSNAQPSITICSPDGSEFRQKLEDACPLLENGSIGKEMGTYAFISPEELNPADFAYVLCDEEFSSIFSGKAHCIREESEPDSELQRMTVNCHYVYMASHDLPENYDAIGKELFSAQNEKIIRNMRSSMLQAIHIPYKLASLEIRDASLESRGAAYETMLTEDPTAAEKILLLEHRRWFAAQILEGFRAPKAEELKDIFLRNGSFRDDKNKIHPCMIECREGSSLEGSNLAFWDDYAVHPEHERYSHLDQLDLYSLKLNAICRELHESNTPRRLALTKALQGERYAQNDVHSLLEILSRIDQRLKQDVAMYRQIYPRACSAVKSAGMNDCLEMLVELDRILQPTIEWILRKDYKNGDRSAAQNLGFAILFARKSKYACIVRELSERIEDNAIAPVFLDPETMYFLVPPTVTTAQAEWLELGLRTFVDLRKMRTKLIFRKISSNTQPESYTSELSSICRETGGSFIVDLTGAHYGFLQAVQDFPSFIAENWTLRNVRHCSAINVYNRVPRNLTVRQMFSLSGLNSYDHWQIEGWNEIEHALPGIIEKYFQLTANGKEKLYTSLCQYLRENAQFEKGKYATLSEDGALSHEGCMDIPTEKANLRNVTSVLYKLQNSNLIKVTEQKTDPQSSQTHYRWSSSSTYLNSAILSMSKTDSDAPFDLTINSSKIKIRQVKNQIRISASDARRSILEQFAPDFFVPDPHSDVFYYANSGVRNILLKDGNLLEDFLFCVCKESALFSSLELSWNFGLDRVVDAHEIDLIALRNNRPFFFSCKIGGFSDNDIKEIALHASRYGINHPKPVFVSTAGNERLTELGYQHGSEKRRAAEEKFGVFFIDREDLSNKNNLIARLTELVNSH